MDLRRHVNSDPRSALPSVNRLSEDLLKEFPQLPRWAVVEAARRVVAGGRRALEADAGAALEPDWLGQARAQAEALIRPRPRRVINATGVVLHTNLGRAPLAPGAAAAAAQAAAGYSDLELDLASGRRGERLAALEEKLCLLSAAEGAYACNNNAAAVLLMLNTLAAGREVIVSRGELVEIGGSFRVPEIMRRASVRLVEVGSTNRTHPDDYASAIGPDTALLLKVHRSNFELRGFVKEVDLGTLVEIGRSHGVPVAEDLGSGSLIDLQAHGFPAESYAPGRLRLGPDLVCFSGDKLMGGPQAGIVLGRAELVSAMRSNPLARALRLDKMTLAALDWTLASMLEGRAEQELPVLRQLLVSAGELETRARELAARLRAALSSAESAPAIEVARDHVPLGGGTLPGFELESWVLLLRAPSGADALASRLRNAATAVISRVRDDAVLIDLRTVDPDEAALLEQAIVAASH